MGIDLLDITFGLQRSCGVKIGVEDFARLAGWDLDPPVEKDLDLTVGQILTFLLERREQIKTRIAQQPNVQECVENVLREHFFHDLRSPNPEESLEEIIPSLDRQRHWEQLAESLNCKLPPLELSRAAKLAVVSPLLALVLAITLAGWLLTYAIDRVWVGYLVIIPGWLAGAFAIREGLATGFVQRRLRIPGEVTTVRRLVDHVTTDRRIEIHAPLQTMTDDEVFATLRDTLVDCLFVKPEEVTPNAKLIADLGAE